MTDNVKAVRKKGSWLSRDHLSFPYANHYFHSSSFYQLPQGFPLASFRNLLLKFESQNEAVAAGISAVNFVSGV